MLVGQHFLLSTSTYANLPIHCHRDAIRTDILLHEIGYFVSIHVLHDSCICIATYS